MRIQYVILFFLIFIISGCSSTGDGMPRGYCDPGGPGPLYIFNEDSGECVFEARIECNMLGDVRDDCLDYSKSEKKQSVDKYLIESNENDLKQTGLVYIKDNNYCITCTNESECPYYRSFEELFETIC